MWRAGIDRDALDRDLRREARLDRKAHIVVGRAHLQRIGGAAVVGGEGDLRPVGEAALEQARDDLRHGMRPDLDEDAVAQLVPHLLSRPSFVVGGEAGGGEGVDGVEVAQARAVAFDHAALLERGSDHAPEPLDARGSPGSRPQASPSPRRGPATMRLCVRNSRLLVIAVIAAAPFIGGGRHGRAGQREDLHRRAVPPRGQPEFEIVRRRRHWRIRGSPRRSRCCRAEAPEPLRIPA